MDFRHRSPAATRMASVILFSLLLLAPVVSAQEAVRPSLAGEAAAETRRQSIDQIPYNLRLGPVRFLFSVTTGVQYNDNINLAEINPQSDVIIRPQFNIDAIWPVTQLNTLKLRPWSGLQLLSRTSKLQHQRRPYLARLATFLRHLRPGLPYQPARPLPAATGPDRAIAAEQCRRLRPV